MSRYIRPWTANLSLEETSPLLRRSERLTPQKETASPLRYQSESSESDMYTLPHYLDLDKQPRHESATAIDQLPPPPEPLVSGHSALLPGPRPAVRAPSSSSSRSLNFLSPVQLTPPSTGLHQKRMPDDVQYNEKGEVITLDIEVCDGNDVRLRCPHHYQLIVLDVFYGRDENTNCNPNPVMPIGFSCSDNNAINIVKNLCEFPGNRVCTFSASSPSPFPTDPCPGAGKVLRVVWGCCEAPNPQPPEEGCSPTAVAVRPVLGDCRATNIVYVNRCEGGCHSEVHYPFGTEKVEKKCQCCVPIETVRRAAELYCDGGRPVSSTFLDVTKCECKPCDEPTGPECHVDEHSVTPTWGDCVGVGPVDLGKCHGGCDSVVGYQFATTRPEQACDCCVPIKTEKLTATLRCRTEDSTVDERWIQKSYTKITDCDCRPCKKRPVEYIDAVSAEDAEAVRNQAVPGPAGGPTAGEAGAAGPRAVAGEGAFAPEDP